jgi:phage shock protein A
MARLGLTQDMLDMANDIGVSLQRAYEGKVAIQESLTTQQQFAKVLDRDATNLFEKAQAAITNNQEDKARELLLQRTEIQDKLKQVLIRCAEDKKRLVQMEENVVQLERRALEIDTLMRRNVSAKTIQDSSDGLGLSLRSEDPLLQKFKDLGID